MAKAIFISFDHDDASQVGGLRASITNPNHEIEFLDRSLKQPVKDSYGKPIMFPPHDNRAIKVKIEIISLMKAASKMIVLIGKNTHSSEWVKWEIDKFLELKNSKRIICMRLKNNTHSGVPSNAKKLKLINWDLNELTNWINYGNI